MMYVDKDMIFPKLVEEQTGYYISHVLKTCHDTKVETYSYYLNVFVVMCFLCITLFILFLLFLRKPTEEQKSRSMLKDQQFILEKIRSLKEQKQFYLENQSISKLPIV